MKAENDLMDLEEDKEMDSEERRMKVDDKDSHEDWRRRKRRHGRREGIQVRE